MSSFFGNLLNETWELRDKRIDGWFLMDSPLPTMTICATYICLVTILLPPLMKDRKPMDIKHFMIVYNFLQVVFSAYIFITAMTYFITLEYSLLCQPVDKSESPTALFIVSHCWMYYISKFTDLIDTFCFLARKKFSHISLLHVVHHSSMPMSIWVAVRFAPGGHGIFPALVNSFIHILMYSYYMIAAMGPQYQRYIWWKRYLTALQLIQFVIIMAHAMQLMFYNDCDFPRQIAYLNGAQTMLFFLLFSHFWIKYYMCNNKDRKEVQLQDFKANHNKNH